VAPCYDIKLLINAQMRNTPVVFITSEDRKLSSTIAAGFGLICVLFSIVLVRSALHGISTEENINECSWLKGVAREDPTRNW
jgi:hypothetical protein